jgi:hypothetical protein
MEYVRSTFYIKDIVEFLQTDSHPAILYCSFNFYLFELKADRSKWNCEGAFGSWGLF